MINKLFKQIDSFIFQKIDILKNTTFYQKIIDQVGTLDEKHQKLLGQISAITLISLPIIFLILVFVANILLRQELNTKEQLIDTLESYIKNKHQAQNIIKEIDSNLQVNSKSDLGSMITAFMSAKNITGKAEVADLTTEESIEGLGKSTAIIRFSNFSSTDLAHFVQNLTEQSKATITNLNVVKENSSMTLRGDISIIIYGRQ